MSASLVGSEMCIRDRSPPHAVLHLNWAHRGPPACRSPSWLHPGRRGYRPVSYTHLTLPTICSV
eukprot:7037351-Alexandrium_andersonii.AAC.1